MYGIDKCLAMLKKHRISEKTLLFVSLMGGCFLSFLAMLIFRHKIRKKYFVIINIIGMLLYMSIIGGYLWK